MTTAPALLPCPFCGGDAELSHVLASVGRNYFAVECADKRGCRVVVSSRAATEAEAIAAWNARPGDAARETAITEAIQALIDASDYFDNRADVNDGFAEIATDFMPDPSGFVRILVRNRPARIQDNPQ